MKEKPINFPVVSEYFMWPADKEEVVYKITRFEAVDQDTKGYVFLNLGGPGYTFIELYLESEERVGYEFLITIYAKKY